MLAKNVPVLYKKAPAVITEIDGDKYVVKYCSAPATPGGKPAKYDTQKVREKDIISFSGENSINVSNVTIEKILSFSDPASDSKIAECYELLSSDEASASAPLSFEELLSLIDSSAPAESVWFYFNLLNERLEFRLDDEGLKKGSLVFIPRSQDEIDALKKKNDEKLHEEEYRQAFIARLKERKLDLPADSKYMGDVEALALGKTDKSKAMAEARIPMTPENAHKLLLETGMWEPVRNPHPVRWGLSMQSASESLSSPPAEDRYEVPGISYAIDNAWSTDPDDAVAFDGEYLWIHIADPASSVMPESSIDKAAMYRGATLYIPEGASRMLCESCLEDYALGLKEKSNALSFRLKLAENGTIDDCTVMKTLVNVKRLTYEQATEMKDSPELAPLFQIAERNVERRRKGGSVEIQLPEVHITVEPETKKVSIVPADHPLASEMVREMMLLAGEGAARFAFKNQIPFPFVSQEAPSIPDSVPEGLAGQFRLVKGMRRRSVGITPAVHSGLGLGMYSQVTSPLRRYGDLIAHEQLRAFIDGRKLIDKDTILERISAGDEAAYACKKAERKSNLHWTMIYLMQNPDWTGEAVCIELKGKQALFMIPSLAQQALLTPKQEVRLNDVIQVNVASMDIPNLELTFQQLH